VTAANFAGIGHPNLEVRTIQSDVIGSGSKPVTARRRRFIGTSTGPST
jgi:hypothetical protein